MDNYDQAERTRNDTTETTFAAEAANYIGNTLLINKVSEFNVSNAANIAAAAACNPDNSGYSQVKNDAKIILSEEAATYSGIAYVIFTDAGKIEIAEKLHVNLTDYLDLADSACSALAQGDYDILWEYKTDIAPDISELMLTEHQTLINTFTGLKGASAMVHDASPALTQAFAESFKLPRRIIEMIKLLMRPYKTSNLPFYERVMASLIIPTVNVHHTYVDILATDNATGNPLEGVVFSLDIAKKSGTTDYEGKATIEKTKSGKDILTGKIAGKTVYTGHIEIKRGRRNPFNLGLDLES